MSPSVGVTAYGDERDAGVGSIDGHAVGVAPCVVVAPSAVMRAINAPPCIDGDVGLTEMVRPLAQLMGLPQHCLEGADTLG